MKQSRLLKLREYPKVAQPLTDKVRRKEKKSPAQQKQNKECFILSSAHVMELSNSHPSKLTAPSLLHCQLKHCPRKDPMVLSFSFQLFSYSPVPRTYSSIRAKSLQLYLPLWSYGLQPARLLCPWDFSGKNTGVGCHPPLLCPPPLQRIFLTQGSHPSLLWFLHQILYRWATREALTLLASILNTGILCQNHSPAGEVYRRCPR